MTSEDALHISRRDLNFLGRVIYVLAGVCRTVAAEAAGPRQAQAVAILSDLDYWAPRFGLQMVTLMTTAQIAAANNQADIPVTTALVNSVFDTFIVKNPA